MCCFAWSLHAAICPAWNRCAAVWPAWNRGAARRAGLLCLFAALQLSQELFRLLFLVVWACFDVILGLPCASATIWRIIFGKGSREMSSRKSTPLPEVLVLLALLPRHPSGCPFSFSPQAVLPHNACSLLLLLLAFASAGSAAFSCAAAGSGSLLGVELCAGGKGNTSGSSVIAFSLPGCPLAANKSCWSAASLGASLWIDLAVKAPCLVKNDVHIGQVVASCPDADTPLLLELEHMRSWFSPEHCLKNGDDDTRVISGHLSLEKCLLVLSLHHEPIMQPRTMSDEPYHCRMVRWQRYTVPLHHIVSPSTHQSL